MEVEMTPEEWERRKDFYRGVSSDMSPAAVARRIDIANGLNRLIRELSGTGRIAPREPNESEESFLARLREAIEHPTTLPLIS